MSKFEDHIDKMVEEGFCLPLDNCDCYKGSEHYKKREPFKGQCKKCDHVWVIAYTPMEAGLFAKVCQKAHCPMCGADSKNISIPPKPKGKENVQ